MEKGLCLTVYLLAIWAVPCHTQSCPDIGGVVAGSIFGTLAVVGLIVAIVLLVLWFKRRKGGKGKQKKAGENGAYDNPNFQLEETEGKSQQAKSVDHAEKGFAGYVECREYESPKKEKNTGQTNSSTSGQGTPPTQATRPNGTAQYLPKNLFLSGSRGSLDNKTTPDPEIMTVEFQSQDIIGLGFNVAGNMREGIYISQIHNRGPASESGKVKLGDRILSITVSCENMVYEDALHILSYASPYPVKLSIQRPAARVLEQQQQQHPQATPNTDTQINLLHPLYRSASMDDLSKIGKDAQTPGRQVAHESSQLKAVMVDVSQEIDIVEAKKSPRLEIPHMKADTSDLIDGEQIWPPGGSVSLENLRYTSAEVLAVDIPGDMGISGRSTSLVEIPTPKMEREHKDKSISDSGLNSSDVSPPIPKGSPPSPRKLSAGDLDVSILPDNEEGENMATAPELLEPYQGLTEEDKLDVLRLSYEDSGVNPLGASISAEDDLCQTDELAIAENVEVILDVKEIRQEEKMDRKEIDSSTANIELSVDTSSAKDIGKNFDPELGTCRLSDSSSDEGIYSPQMGETTAEVVIETTNSEHHVQDVALDNIHLEVESQMLPESAESEAALSQQHTEQESIVQEVVESPIIASRKQIDVTLLPPPSVPLPDAVPIEHISHETTTEDDPTLKKRDSSDEEDKGFVDVDVLSQDKSAPQSPIMKEVQEATIEPLMVSNKSQISYSSISLKPEDFEYKSPSVKKEIIISKSSVEVETTKELALREDESVPLESACDVPPVSSRKLDMYADDTVKAVLKDYFSDSPSLMEELGLTPPVSKDPAPEDEEYEVDSLDSEDASPVRTGSYNVQGSLSSKESSRSPTPEKEICTDLEHSTSVDTSKPKKWVAASPEVTKKSSGGLTFDISQEDFEEMPMETPQKERGPPKGGTAFYVNIDENAFHAVPAMATLNNDSDSESEHSLFKTTGLMDLSAVESSSFDLPHPQSQHYEKALESSDNP